MAIFKTESAATILSDFQKVVDRLNAFLAKLDTKHFNNTVKINEIKEDQVRIQEEQEAVRKALEILNPLTGKT